MPVVEVEHLTGRYGDVVAVDDVSFTAPAATVTAVLGPNGAGKTSTIECCEGYRVPTSGTVRVAGLDPIADRAALARRIGVMLQDGSLYTAITPREALRLFASYYDRARDPEELLSFVGLAERGSARWRTLSGGEQQRLNLALALVGRPTVVFLDEPTAGVDVSGRRLIGRLIVELAREGTTVVLTTHDLAEVEALAQRIVIIDHGRLVADDTAEALLSGDTSRSFTFRAAAGLDTASMSAAVGAMVTPTDGRYRVDASPSPSTVAALTAWLADRDVLLDDLQAGRQQLEQVFLSLTEDGANEDLASDRAESAGARSHRRAGSNRRRATR
ncbi:MAG: ABC transporter ATP-binding protein [Microthrixaceae bacterium]